MPAWCLVLGREQVMPLHVCCVTQRPCSIVAKVLLSAASIQPQRVMRALLCERGYGELGEAEFLRYHRAPAVPGQVRARHRGS